MYSRKEYDSNREHSFTSKRPPVTGNGGSGLRNPSLDNTTYVLILSVVLIPIIFTVILCIITYCIYRHNKNRSDRAPTNSPIAPMDRSGTPINRVVYNTQHNPFVFEESPPSYDSLASSKKDTHDALAENEQVQLRIFPNSSEEVTSAAVAVLPTAPIQHPPSYIDLGVTNK